MGVLPHCVAPHLISLHDGVEREPTACHGASAAYESAAALLVHDHPRQEHPSGPVYLLLGPHHPLAHRGGTELPSIPGARGYHSDWLYVFRCSILLEDMRG